MEDLIKSMKAHLYDRIASPLSGALIISWCFWNYKVLLVIFSSEIIQYKLNFIDTFYAQSFSSFLWTPDSPMSNALINGMFGPICTAFVYILIYPIFSVPVYMFSLLVQKVYEGAKNWYQQGKLLTYTQSVELHRQISELELQKENEHKRYLASVEMLNTSNEKNKIDFLKSEGKYAELKAKYDDLNVLYQSMKSSSESAADDVMSSEPDLERKSNVTDDESSGDSVDVNVDFEQKESKTIYEIFGVNHEIRLLPKEKIYGKFIKEISEKYSFGSFDVPYMFGSIWESLENEKRDEWVADFYKNVSSGYILGVKVVNDKLPYHLYSKCSFSEIENIGNLMNMVLSCFRIAACKKLVMDDLINLTDLPGYYVRAILSVAEKKEYVVYQGDYCALTDHGDVYCSLGIDRLLERYMIASVES